MIDAALVREALRVTFCPTCRLDTMPDDRTGKCFWCDTVIAEPNPDAPRGAPSQTHGFCAWCDEPLIGSVLRRYCGRTCKDAAWSRSDAGAAKTQRHNERRRALRSEAVA